MKKKDNNIFNHGGKEFVIDTFLSWLLTESNYNEKLSGFKEDFLAQIAGLSIPEGEHIKEFRVKRQVNNVDLLVSVDLKSGEKKIIFENKMYSTLHHDQLKRYKDAFDKASAYLFLKLGYINELEKQRAKANGYKVIGAEEIYSFLETYRGAHSYISDFLDYIELNFVGLRKQLNGNFENNNFEDLKDASFQQFIMDQIYGKLTEESFSSNKLKYKTGHNYGGNPWTQLTFSSVENFYEGKNESLFYRIDKRSGKYYLRVNLYSKKGTSHWDIKKARLQKLRIKASSLVEKNKLNPGKVHNRGRNECEVLILFFEDENPLQDAVDAAHDIAFGLREIHHGLSA